MFVMEVCFYLANSADPDCGISSGFSLFAKLHVCRIQNELQARSHNIKTLPSTLAEMAMRWVCHSINASLSQF